MDKKLAKEFVKKVSPLEHSKNPHDRAEAKRQEAKLRKINNNIPEPKGELKKVRES